MSADAWKVCPRCRLTEEAAIEADDVATAKAYGEIPAEEWKALTLKAQERRANLESMKETFREDYEIGIDDAGEFEVGYSGGCNTCGLQHEFKHSEKLKL